MSGMALHRFGCFEASGGGPPPGPVGIPYTTAEGLSEVSDTGTSWLDVATLDVDAGDFGPSEDMFGFWTVSGQSNSLSSEIKARLTLGGSDIFTTDPLVFPKEVGSPIDYITFGGLFRHQPGGSPASAQYKIQVARGSGAATFKGKDGRISLLRQGDDDYYAESIARQRLTDTTANKTKSVVGSIIFSPSTSGDYYILCSCQVDTETANTGRLTLELTDGTVTSGDVTIDGVNAADRNPVLLMIPLSAVSGSKTVDLKFHNSSSNNTIIAISEIRFAAIRSDRFANVYSTRLTTHNEGTDTTTTSALSQTFTPAATDHLTIGGGVFGCNSTGNSSFLQVDDGGTTVNELIRECQSAPLNSDEGLAFMGHRIATYAASSRTQRLTRRSESGSTVRVQRGFILTLDLDGL